MKEKIKKIISKILNRKEESFSEFLKKYWWIEFLALIKVIYLNEGYYAIQFLIVVFFVLWLLYRIGLE